MAIRFDLDSIPEDEEIISATLDMFVGGYNGNGFSGDYSAYRMSRSWVDTEADWENAAKDTPWNNPGGDFVANEIDKITVEREEGYGFRSFDVLATVKDFVANPEQNFGFLLKHVHLAQELDIASADYEVAEWRPKLTIEHTVPASSARQSPTGCNVRRNPVTFSTGSRTLHITNNGATPTRITLTRLDGTTVASDVVPGGVRETVSVRNAGVYLITISGSNGTRHEKISLYR